ncbi:MAG: hypothetical protein ABIH10_01490 [Spirochaetota bacterium]
MTKWLRKIIVMMNEIPKDFKVDFSALPEKEEEGEEKKGTLSQETYALFRLLNWLKKEYDNVCSSCGKNGCRESLHKASALSDDMDTIKEILFSSIRYELGLNSYDCPVIGIRKNGVVVAMPKKIGIVSIITGDIDLPIELAGILAGMSKKPY